MFSPGLLAVPNRAYTVTVLLYYSYWISLRPRVNNSYTPSWVWSDEVSRGLVMFYFPDEVIEASSRSSETSNFSWKSFYCCCVTRPSRWAADRKSLRHLQWSEGVKGDGMKTTQTRELFSRLCFVLNVKAGVCDWLQTAVMWPGVNALRSDVFMCRCRETNCWCFYKFRIFKVTAVVLLII